MYVAAGEPKIAELNKSRLMTNKWWNQFPLLIPHTDVLQFDRIIRDQRYLIKPSTVTDKTSRIWCGLWVFRKNFLLWIYSIYLEHKKTKNIEICHTNANKIWPHLSTRFLYIEQLMSRLKEKILRLGLSAVEKYLTARGSQVSFKQFHLREKSCENTAQPCLTMMFQ